MPVPWRRALAVGSGAAAIGSACTYGVPAVIVGSGDASQPRDAGGADSLLQDQTSPRDQTAGDRIAVDAPSDEVAPVCTIAWVNNTTATGTSLTVPAPGSLTPGDLLLTYILGSSGDPTPPALTPPAEWTLVGRVDQVADETFLAVYSKTVGSGETASYAWTSTTMIYATMWLLHYTGVDAVQPIDTQATYTDPDASVDNMSSYEAPSIQTSGSDEMVIATFGDQSFGLDTWNAPAGMTQRLLLVDPNEGAVVASNEVTWPAPGTAGPFVATLATDGGNAGVVTVLTETVALRPCQ